MTLALAGIVLAGCSTGGARDARRDQAQDAGLAQHLEAEQATRTVQRYFPPTTTPAPTAAPLPALGGLVITFGFRADGTPDGSYASVPAGAGTAYAAARLTGAAAGQVVRAVVTDGWGNEIAVPEVTIDAGAADRWVALPIGLPGDLTPGEFGVFVFVDDQPVGSVAFGISGPGSSAQLLPELPANPKARAPIQTPGPEGAPTATTVPAA